MNIFLTFIIIFLILPVGLLIYFGVFMIIAGIIKAKEKKKIKNSRQMFEEYYQWRSNYDIKKSDVYKNIHPELSEEEKNK